MRLILSIVFILVTFISSLSAQKKVRFVGTQVDKFSFEETLKPIFRDYKLFRIDENSIAQYLTNDYTMKRADYHDKRFSLALEGQADILINLHSYDLLSEDFRLRIGNKIVRSNQKYCRTYMGMSNTDRVAWTITQEGFVVYFKGNKDSYYLEPLKKYDNTAPEDIYVYYKANNVINHGHTCGLETTHNVTQEMNKRMKAYRSSESTPNGCVKIRLSVASLLDMYNHHGTNLVPYIESIINNVNTDYDSDFNNKVEFEIVETVVATDANHSLETAIGSASNAGTILTNFAVWASNGGFSATHDLGTLFTKRDILADDGSSGTVGLAYVNVLCSSPTSKYSIIEDFSTNANNMRQVVSHEIGHNFGCGHDAGGTSFIMAPTVNGSTTWSTNSQTIVDNKLDSPPCNSGAGELEGSATAEFVLPDLSCSGVLFLQAFSRGTTSWSWSVQDGSPSTSTMESFSTTISGSGQKTITLTATNDYTCDVGSGSVTTSKQLTVYDPVTVAINCTTDYFSNTGQNAIYGCSPTNVSFNTINRTSPNVDEDKLVWDDVTCVESTSVEAGSSYDLSVTKNTGFGGNDVGVKVWIDYNNNGDFSDVGEEVVSFAPNTIATQSASVTIPLTAVKNTPLRMRVITDLGNISNHCIKPEYGQVEDYAVTITPKQCDPVALSSSSSNIATTACDDANGWTYYENSDNQSVFAIEWGTGNDAAKSAASVTITKTDAIYGETSAEEATYTMSRYWNVDIGGNSIVNAVNARFYYDIGEKTDVDDAANTFAGANTNADYESGVWFKTTSGSFDPATNVTPATIEGVTAYNVDTGTENGVDYVQYNGLTSFSGGSYGAGAGAGDSVLPVTLKSFKVDAERKCNTVMWETTTEKNTEYIELQKSIDGKNWNIIATISALGDKDHGAEYQEKDYDISMIDYYRLNTVDYDGYEELSHIVVANRDHFIDRSLHIEPNPTISEVTVYFNTGQKEQMQISIYDLFGHEMMSKAIQSKQGVNRYVINLDELAQGTYIMCVKGSNYVNSEKVMKI